MDALLTAFAGMLGKIADPVVIVLILLLARAEYLKFIQGKEHNKDRNEVLLPALRQITADLQKIQEHMADQLGDVKQSIADVKNAISAMTGRAM